MCFRRNTEESQVPVAPQVQDESSSSTETQSISCKRHHEIVDAGYKVNKVGQAIQKYQKDLLFENRQKPTKSWNCIKNIFLSKESVPIQVTATIKNVKNIENANSLCTFFTKIGQNLKHETFRLRDFIWKKPTTPAAPMKIFNSSYVSHIFVERELKLLKSRKTAGCDDLSSGILKEAAYAPSNPLSYLINLSLSTALVPKKWKIGKVTPIYKKENTNHYNDYRPISVLNTCTKILEWAVHKKLIDHFECNDLLTKTQFGYRENKSTELATILLSDNIWKDDDEDHLVGVLFVDLSKAFDRLIHSALLEKLKSFGITGRSIIVLLIIFLKGSNFI